MSLSQVSLAVSALSIGQSLISMLECLDVTMNMTAESKFQPPSGCDEPPGTVDQLLDDGLDPSALGRVTNDPFTGHKA
jgi:hypothetical protein